MRFTGLAQASDEGFDALYRRISPRLARYLRAAEPAEAEDIAADVWLAIVGQLTRFAGDANGFEALVFTIARRRVTDHRRRRTRRRTDLVANDAFAHHADREHPERQVVDDLHARDVIATLLADLPAAQAEVVLLRVVAGLQVEQVAAILRRSPGAVRVMQHRALKRLRA